MTIWFRIFKGYVSHPWSGREGFCATAHSCYRGNPGTPVPWRDRQAGVTLSPCYTSIVENISKHYLAIQLHLQVCLPKFMKINNPKNLIACTGPAFGSEVVSDRQLQADLHSVVLSSYLLDTGVFLRVSRLPWGSLCTTLSFSWKHYNFLFLSRLFLFSVYECFACTFVYAPHTCLMPRCHPLEQM